MKNNNQENVMALNVIANKAKQLAYDVEHHKLWEGDLKKGVAELNEQLSRVKFN